MTIGNHDKTWNAKGEKVLPDPGGCSQQMLLEARIPAIAKSIAISAAAAEDHGGHSQLASWLLFAAGTVGSSGAAVASFSREDQNGIEA